MDPQSIEDFLAHQAFITSNNLAVRAAAWAKKNPSLAASIAAAAVFGGIYLMAVEKPREEPNEEPSAAELPRRERLLNYAKMVIECGTGYLELVHEAELVHAFVAEVDSGDADQPITPELLSKIEPEHRDKIVRLAAYARLQPEALDPEQLEEYATLEREIDVTPQLMAAAAAIRAKIGRVAA